MSVIMERTRGWYWVKTRAGYWEVAIYEDDGNWYRAGIDRECPTDHFAEVGEKVERHAI